MVLVIQMLIYVQVFFFIESSSTVKSEDFSNEKDITVSTVDPGHYVMTTHTGPYKLLEKSWLKLREWEKMTGNTLESISKGNYLEFYINDPSECKNDSEYITELYAKINRGPRPNNLCHIDFIFEDQKRCQTFYSNVFQWKFMNWRDDYFLYSSPDIFNCLQGGFTKKTNLMKIGNTTVPYIEVLDVKSTLETVKNNGGKNLTNVEKLGDFGLMGFFDDTEGNRIGLYQTLH